MNYELKVEKKKVPDFDDRKCYPKRATNLMPYHKIEIEIRKDAQWPPITEDPNAELPAIQEMPDETFTATEENETVTKKMPESEILSQINNLTNEAKNNNNSNNNNEVKKRQRFDEQNLETSFWTNEKPVEFLKKRN